MANKNILNEVEDFKGTKVYTQVEIDFAKIALATLANGFNKIGRSDAAAVIKNLKNNESGTAKVRSLLKLADLVVKNKGSF